MYLNFSALFVVGFFFVLSSFQADSRKLVKLCFLYVICLLLLFIVYFFIGGDPFLLAKLGAGGKIGVAAGGLYGCILGTGIGYFMAWLREKNRNTSDYEK